MVFGSVGWWANWREGESRSFNALGQGEERGRPRGRTGARRRGRAVGRGKGLEHKVTKNFEFCNSKFKFKELWSGVAARSEHELRHDGWVLSE